MLICYRRPDGDLSTSDIGYSEDSDVESEIESELETDVDEFSSDSDGNRSEEELSQDSFQVDQTQ